MPENRHAWELWKRVNTQWRIGMNGPVGLDYQSVFIVANIYALGMTPALFEKIRALEIFTLERKSRSDD